MSSWGMARSEFNHSWLKNRFIVALGRAHNVLTDLVEDDSIFDDLSEIFSEWQERKVDAQQILEDYRAEASPRSHLNRFPLSNLDPELREWLGLLIELRWEQTEHSYIKLADARQALHDFDELLIAFSTMLPQLGYSVEERKTAASCIVELRNTAKHLADTFGKLG